MTKELTHSGAAARFATIDALHEFGVTMASQKFKAQHRDADEAIIHAMTLYWLGYGNRMLLPGFLRTEDK